MSVVVGRRRSRGVTLRFPAASPPSQRSYVDGRPTDPVRQDRKRGGREPDRSVYRDGVRGTPIPGLPPAWRDSPARRYRCATTTRPG